MILQIESRITIYGDDKHPDYAGPTPLRVLASSAQPITIDQLDNGSDTMASISAAAVETVEDLVNNFKRIMRKEGPIDVPGAQKNDNLQQQTLQTILRMLNDGQLRILEGQVITLPDQPSWYCIKVKKV